MTDSDSDSDYPWEPPLAGTDVEHLVGALERQRATFRWKADGLGAAGLRARVGASTMTLGGLLKHLARAEEQMFTTKLSGAPLGPPWDTAPWQADPDWDFNSAADDTPEQLYALWDGTVARSRARLEAALADGGLEQLVHLSWPDGRHVSLRRLVCDLVEEYGRHTGHADLIREAVDGRVGEDPPGGWRATGAAPATAPAADGSAVRGVRYVDADLTGSRFERVDLTGARFTRVDLSRAAFRSAYLDGTTLRAIGMRNVVLRGGELCDVDIHAELQNVTINGVGVAKLVEDELDRRHPDRVAMRPTDAAGFRAAWEAVERLWDGTVQRARGLDPELLHASVNEEWSFVETLRHLVFATDAWVRRAILGDPAPWDPLDLPWDDAPEMPGVPHDRDVRPSLDDVLALRRDRMASVRRFLDDLTDESLDRLTDPIDDKAWPDRGYPVRQCLRVVLNEEWEHRLYAERDLDALAARNRG